MRHLLVVALLCSPALADPSHTTTPDVRAMHTDDCAKARKQNKTCVLDIGGEDVRGNGVTPNGSSVRVVETAKQPTLIRLRKDFIVEILKSAEDL